MIILTGITDKIQVILGGNVTTNQLQCFASYRDTTSTTIEAKRNATNTNDTTAVDLVASPASSTQRIVDYISIYNSDTTEDTVTIRFNDNGTFYTIFSGTINSGERIEYQEEEGFKIMTAKGEFLMDSVSGRPSLSNSMSYVYKSTDQTVTGTTFTDISGLSFSVTAGKTYWFRFVVPFTVGGTAVGCRFAVNGPASPTILYYQTDVSTSSTLKSINRGITIYDGTVTSLNSASTAGNLAFIEGIIKPSSDGTLIGRFASESANPVTQKAGAFIQYIEI